jgi:zinc protease
MQPDPFLAMMELTSTYSAVEDSSMLRSFVLLGLCAFPSFTFSADPKTPTSTGAKVALQAAEALYAGIRHEKLPNGLQVYLKPIEGATSVTTMLGYKVGSCDEDKTSTGLAHYLEHLLFKGTDKLKPGDVDRITFRNGGNNNAYTSADLTCYYFNVPSGRWKAMLEIEADRMRNTRIDKAHEFDKEKGAVINELIGGEDQPWDLEYKALLPLLYGKEHPYGHPVIGQTSHVKDATEKTITDFYDRWYHPNNAALVLVGGFDPEEALTHIKKLFGDIPAGTLPQRKTAPAEGAKLPARLQMKSKFSVPRMLWAVPTVPSGHPDQAALEILEAVLSMGKRSRLYRSLVEELALCSMADTSHSPGRFPGWFAVYAELLPESDPAVVEKQVLAVLQKLRDQPPSAQELARVKQQVLASAVFRRETPNGLARTLIESVLLNDLDFAKGYLPALLAVTPADVQRVAKKYLLPERSATVWSIPGAPQERGARPGSLPALAKYRDTAKEPALAVDLKKTRRVELPNGLVLLLYPNRRLPTLEARVQLRDAALFQADDKRGVTTLTGALLDEGTPKRTSEQIADTIETLGGVLNLSGVGGSVKVLAPDRKLGLEILFDCLMHPVMPEDAFRRAKARLAAQVMEEEVLPETRAQHAFYELVYVNHPLGKPISGTLQTVKTLTRADCLSYHSLVFRPNNTIVAVVGDFEPDAVIAEIKGLTADWKSGRLPKRTLPEVKLPEQFTQKIITMPDASQLQFFMGHVGIRRTNPDYFPLLVMDYILGTGPGFTDRLSSRLRDREGLAYTVNANITNSASKEPGTFTCYIGTDKENFARVKKLFLEELHRIRDTLPEDTELDDAKTYLLGSSLMRFGSNAGIAEQLLNIERFGLGLDYLEKSQKAIAAVTAREVQRVARKYLHPERMVLTAAGAVDAEGKPLKNPGEK